MGKHSPVGPSSCYQFWACPGSVRMQKDIPEQTSPYAVEGQNAHALAALCLIKKRPPLEFVGETMEEGDRTWVITEEMAAAVQEYYNAVCKVIAEEGCHRMNVEKKVRADHIDKDAYGTSDLYFITKKTNVLYVWDYKHGAGVAVDASQNKQMLYYAAAVLEYGLVDKVKTVIVQPRIDSQDHIKIAEYTADEVHKFGLDLKAKIAETRDPNAPINAGSWCRFCTAKFKCSAFTGSMKVLTPEKMFDKIPLDLPAEKYGQMYINAIAFQEKFSKWFDSLSSILYAMANEGTPAPGTKLVRGRKIRKWKDEKLVIDNFAEYGKAIYETKLKSPAQLEKVVGKEEIEVFIEETSSLKLAVDTDIRPEIKSLEHMFDDLS